MDEGTGLGCGLVTKNRHMHIRDIIGRRWPGLTASLVFWVAMAWIVRGSERANQGHIIYALDDAYIGMAIAKNIALHGVYGVCKYHVTGASSSILWPWLIALCYRVFGVNELAPLVGNMAAGTGIIWLTDRVLAGVEKTKQHPKQQKHTKNTNRPNTQRSKEK